MNVYDFDGTVFVGDSENLFFSFLYHKKGYRLLKPRFQICQKLVSTGVLTKTEGRQAEYRVLKKIHRRGELRPLLEEYWDSVWDRMMPWYLEAKRPDDVIATGNPEFLMIPALERLGVKGIAGSDVNPEDGTYRRKAAVAEDKLAAFCLKYRTEDIDAFYSDAYSDYFLADAAKKAYIVTETQERVEWNEYFREHPEKKRFIYRR